MSSVRVVPPAKNARVFVAEYDFHSRSTAELQLRRGDHVEIIERDEGCEDGLYLGRSLKSMHVGLFPKNFAEPQRTPLGVVSLSPPTRGDSYFPTASSMGSPASHAPPTAPAARSPTNLTSYAQDSATTAATTPGSMFSNLDGLRASSASTDYKSASEHTIEKVAAWSPAEVADWVTSCGFEESVAQKFALNDISGQILLELEMTHLKEFLDIPSFGKRFEIWRGIEALREAVDQKSYPPPPLPASYRRSMINERPPPKRQYAPSLAPHQRIPSYDRNFSFHSGHKLTSSCGTTDSGFAESSPNTPALVGEQLPSYATIPSLNHQPAIVPTLKSLVNLAGHRKAVSAESRRSYVEGSRALNGTHSRGNSADTVRMLRHHAATNDPRSASRLTLVDTTGLLPSARQSILTLEPRRRSEETARPTIANDAPLVPEKDSKEMSGMDVKPFKEMKIITTMPPGVTVLEGKPTILGPTSAPPVPAPTPFAVPNGSAAPSPVLSSNQDSFKKPSYLKKESFIRTGVMNPTNRRQRRPTALVEGLRTVTPQESANTAEFSGWLSKRGGSGVGTWKMRFFCLHGTRLSYFCGMTDVRERGLIDINSHRVAPADSNRLMTISQAGKYCFKLTPPAPGTSRGLTFTPPRLHYFAADSKDNFRAWMGALIKATIGRDESVPVTSSCAIPTIPLEAAQELKARPPAMKIDLSETRKRQISSGSVESSVTPGGTPELKFCDMPEEEKWDDALRIAWASQDPSQLAPEEEESPHGTPAESFHESFHESLQEPYQEPEPEPERAE